MSGLKLLKNRLENVKSIRKITSAMNLVSSVKFKKLEKRVLHCKDYSMLLDQSLTSYLANKDQSFIEPEIIYSTREIKSVLILVYSAAKGLCGSYNLNMSKMLKQKIIEFQNKGMNVSCFCIGRKLKPMLELLLKKEQIKYLDNVEKQTNIENIKTLSNYLIKRYKSHLYDGVYLLYNEYFSAVNSKLVFKRLIPFTDILPKAVEHCITSFSHKVDDVFHVIISNYITAYLNKALLESLTSEYATRMIAMDAANRNADDMIKILNLEYNKRRQAMITNELIEVISGAEAV